ncbi:MAG TPA: adenylate/guanylate cyclase domain-containing protein [Bosea sp. (in: a-proteobacteria)]|jgi:class 3 adenylate cyclase|uniref:adenylate/guanylate cyclase domain-containing protein n=1 Tax=Bosea sp. (in: a-proteobacteria) TaxID=1871050 RepID=UPI002E100FD8|nr:adenylate/guanylate cyclase domain-containing protein [Bosea sp. (in: a-proteobacteria)]
MNDARSVLDVLRQSVSAEVVDAIESLIATAPDRKLNRVNVLAFAAERGLDEEQAIAGFLHASRLGLFEFSWNVLCPGCGGVLDAGASLKHVRDEVYTCALCAAGYEPSLDEMVEVTFTVSPNVRRIEAHYPHQLPPAEYFRQIYWGSGVDLPEENYEAMIDEFIVEALELPAGDKAVISLQIAESFIIVFEPVTHVAQFIEVKGEPTKDRQTLSLVFDRSYRHSETLVMRPGALRIALDNHTDVRTLPSVCVANDVLHDVLGKRRPFLTAKRILSNQTFRDIHRTDTLDVDQRFKIASLTFLFTDLRGSTELYERVGDLAAFDLVRAHFRALSEIVASETGAVVKTIGDAVMASFPAPERAIAAAIRMRDAMRGLNRERGKEDMILKIGIHEGPCIAVSLNERQDYFGQTVNIASRVQHLAASNEIFTTDAVLGDPRASDLLAELGLKPQRQNVGLRGISRDIGVFVIQ